MDMDAKTSKIVAKKVWSILRIMLTMMKKLGINISKGNLIMSLNLFLKKGNHLAHKAINGLNLQHNSLICRPNYHHPPSSSLFFSPSKLHYEFSCNNSPALGPYLIQMAHHHKPKPKPRPKTNCHLEDPAAVAAVHRVLEMLNTPQSDPITGSPRGMEYSLPGFGNGKSPVVRQLRVTDSPFPLKDGKGNNEEFEEDVKVSKAAEEFIKKFYKNLRMQKSLDSPYHMWAR